MYEITYIHTYIYIVFVWRPWDREWATARESQRKRGVNRLLQSSPLNHPTGVWFDHLLGVRENSLIVHTWIQKHSVRDRKWIQVLTTCFSSEDIPHRDYWSYSKCVCLSPTVNMCSGECPTFAFVLGLSYVSSSCKSVPMKAERGFMMTFDDLIWLKKQSR